LGWGLSGICPGPGLVLLARPDLHAVSFFGGTALGMLLAHKWPRRTDEAAVSAGAG
jgi:uncharacterized membrane protein YedE/YeeE